MANTESCVLAPFLVEYLEEKEAIKSLRDKYQELTLEFASVKVEFCDLDGMGWQKPRGRSANGEQNLSPRSTSSLDENRTSSFPHAKAVDSGRNKSRSRKKLKGLNVVTSSYKVEKSETEDGADDDFNFIQYTGGTSLFRSGSSSFVNTFETSDPDTPIEDLGNDDLRVKTPRPLPAGRVPVTSYFDK
ncbi:hypothetical protein E1B28_003620 [Marasmius oreades]|uniref:Uncharacterized protein n=1 Tax=Marasmius oreades TaxID=181124 RepID=A0A9P7RMX9_9AGAR|nr:uncharacterized protein E1B28_003620 [Marasmius oreades]KAG7086106.1 hypothetical protein E1B28_003620 [Marasmius oreades]